MHNGYRGIIAATWLSILLATPAAAKHQNPHPRPHPRATPRAAGAVLPPDQELELYSRRALRRARTILQLELLQLREERLECVREVLEQRLPQELLWDADARKRYHGKKPACLNEGGEDE